MNIQPLLQTQPPATSRLHPWLAIAPEFAAALPAFGIRTQDDLFSHDAGAHKISWSENSVVWKIDSADADAGSIIYKRYFYTSTRYAGRLSRSTVECLNFLAWKRLGIPGPETLAVGEIRRCGLLRQAVIVTRFIPGCITLAEYCRSPGFQQDAARRGCVLEQAATLAGRAHAKGFFHRDLKLRNILVQHPGGAESPHVFWIDCPRGGFHRLDRRRLAKADLADMGKLLYPAITEEERQQFLEAYARAKAARA